MLREYSTDWCPEFIDLMSRWYKCRLLGIGPTLHQFGPNVWEYSSMGVGTGSTPSENRIRRITLEDLFLIVQAQELEVQIMSLRKPVQSVMITVEERREA